MKEQGERLLRALWRDTKKLEERVLRGLWWAPCLPLHHRAITQGKRTNKLSTFSSSQRNEVNAGKRNTRNCGSVPVNLFWALSKWYMCVCECLSAMYRTVLTHVNYPLEVRGVTTQTVGVPFVSESTYIRDHNNVHSRVLQTALLSVRLKYNLGKMVNEKCMSRILLTKRNARIKGVA